jgi:hypothetical protein
MDVKHEKYLVANGFKNEKIFKRKLVGKLDAQ